MPRFDASQAECTVFTYKEGLLSPIAHDLQIAVTRFTVELSLEPLEVRARFDAASLRVVTALRDGQSAPQLLSEKDRRKIEHTIAAEILEAAAFPEISFVSTTATAVENGTAITGRLTLHGQTRELRFTAALISNRHVAEAVVHQPDFGIQPYSALLGTLRIRPDVKVRLSLPIA